MRSAFRFHLRQFGRAATVVTAVALSVLALAASASATEAGLGTVVYETADTLVDLDLQTSRSISARDTTETFTHSADAWGAAASAGSAAISYTLNAGASTALGSYADADAATWTPTKSGTYVFTHSPGSALTATFNVELPYDGTGTAEDPYIVSDAENFATLLAAGGVIQLAGNLLVNGAVSAGNVAVIDINGHTLSGVIDNAGTLTVRDSGEGVFRAKVTGDGTFINELVTYDSTVVIDSVQQRYPWNGLVDIVYTVSELDPEKTYAVRFFATVNGVTKTFEAAVDGEGTRTLTWDAAAATAFGTGLVHQPLTVSAALYCKTVAEKPAEPLCRVDSVEYSDLAKAFEAACESGSDIEFLYDVITVPPFSFKLTGDLDLSGVTLHTTMTIVGEDACYLMNATVDSICVTNSVTDSDCHIQDSFVGSICVSDSSGITLNDCQIRSLECERSTWVTIEECNIGDRWWTAGSAVVAGPAVVINSSDVIEFLRCDIEDSYASERIRITGGGTVSLNYCMFSGSGSDVNFETAIVAIRDGKLNVRLWSEYAHYLSWEVLLKWFDVSGTANVYEREYWDQQIYSNGAPLNKDGTPRVSD